MTTNRDTRLTEYTLARLFTCRRHGGGTPQFAVYRCTRVRGYPFGKNLHKNHRPIDIVAVSQLKSLRHRITSINLFSRCHRPMDFLIQIIQSIQINQRCIEKGGREKGVRMTTNLDTRLTEYTTPQFAVYRCTWVLGYRH